MVFCIRPDSTPYDQEYWASNQDAFFKKYLDKKGIVYNFDQVLAVGYMEEVIANHYNLPWAEFYPVPVPKAGEEMDWYKALA